MLEEHNKGLLREQEELHDRFLSMDSEAGQLKAERSKLRSLVSQLQAQIDRANDEIAQMLIQSPAAATATTTAAAAAPSSPGEEVSQPKTSKRDGNLSMLLLLKSVRNYSSTHHGCDPGINIFCDLRRFENRSRRR